MARAGYSSSEFNGKSGKAGYDKPSGGWSKKTMALLLAATALCGTMEANYQFQDFKGYDPALTPAYQKLSPEMRKFSIDAADLWSLSGALRDRPVNALPDHSLVCIPNNMAERYNNAAAGSPEANYFQEIELHADLVKQRHTEPNMSYGENENHRVDFDGHWLFYANKGEEKLYENGQRPLGPLYAQAYKSASYPLSSLLSKLLSFLFGNAFNGNIECGNTEGHKTGPNSGPENYNQASYLLTHDGTKIPVPK